jgi:hypothetical protein
MDDLSPELRLIAEMARAASLTRADKARLWNRLEEKVKAPAPPRWSVPSVRRHWLPLSVAAALLLGLGVMRHAAELEITVASGRATPVAVDGVEPPERRVVVIPQQLPRERSVLGGLDNERAHALNARPAPRRPRTRSASNVPPIAAVEPAQAESPNADLEGPVTPRVQPARTRTLASPALSVPVAVAAAAREKRSLTPRPPSFQEKLAAENLARYQAAIAQQARLAAIRRSPSSIGGYGAW